jgi:RCC1 and BTB domain-containing protein
VAVTVDGRLFTWGSNHHSQLGISPAFTTNTPTHVPLPSQVVNVACGWYHTLVTTESHGVYAWGSNGDGELGIGTQKTQATPVPVQSPAEFPITRIFAGGSRSFFLTSDGSLYSCGWYYHGGLGHGDSTLSRVSPKLLFSRQDISEIVCGAAHTVVLLNDNSVIVWGKNINGQLGIGTKENVWEPYTAEIFSEEIVGIGAGWNHTWAISKRGNLYLFGSDEDLQLGFPDDTETEFRCLSPRLFAGVKFRTPNNFWNSVFRWIFLGRLQKNSFFSGLPVEVIFQFVMVRRDL